MAKITCIGPCGEEKDASQFYGTSKKCKPCTLARQKELKEAKAGGTPVSPKRKGGGTKTKRAKRVVTGATEKEADASRWERPSGFGFAVQLRVDAGNQLADIHVEQTTADLSTQNIWLNQAEARELHSWLTEKLGV